MATSGSGKANEKKRKKYILIILLVSFSRNKILLFTCHIFLKKKWIKKGKKRTEKLKKTQKNGKNCKKKFLSVE